MEDRTSERFGCARTALASAMCNVSCMPQQWTITAACCRQLLRFVAFDPWTSSNTYHFLLICRHSDQRSLPENQLPRD
jgi:hypothetical protein